MFLKRVLVGLGVFAGLAAAVDLDPTPMTVNNAQYELHCRAGSDPNYPCFTFIGGDLRDVRAEMYIEGDAVGDNAPTTDFLVKGDQMQGKYLLPHRDGLFSMPMVWCLCDRLYYYGSQQELLDLLG
jgi:hypothetical protein